MKVLVIGGGRETSRLHGQWRASSAGTGPFVHFADAEQALRELESGVERYGWVLVAGDADGSDAMQTAAAIRERGVDLPVAVFNHYHPEAPARARTAPALCAVETTCDGLQLLRCALHKASQQTDGARALRDAVENQPLVFEYHAPSRKAR